MSEAIKVIIVRKEEWSYIAPTKYEVFIKASPEFMREPFITDEKRLSSYLKQYRKNFIKN